MPTHCPECRHPVPPHATACPNCPASWENEEEDGALPRRHGPDISIPMPVLWLGMLGLLVLMFWKGMSRFIDVADEQKDGFFTNVVANHIQDLDPKTARATKGGPGDGTMGSYASFHQRSANAPDPELDESLAQKDTENWHFRGRIIDANTLAPVADCKMEFVPEHGGARAAASADEDGYYRVTLKPREGGYRVLLAKAGYASGYLEPGQDVAGMSPEDREAASEDAIRSNDSYDVEATGPEVLPTDFYLPPLPAAKK